MSRSPHLSVQRSKQALRFCTAVELPVNSVGRSRPTPRLLASSSTRNIVTYSQASFSVLAEDSMKCSSHAERAREHWRKLGSPKFIVAPMVDQSELPFRMLCRRYGATAAYTPMLHARLFSEGSKYRAEHFTTCPEDRPLFVQFCANDADVLVNAAQYVEGADYIDLNFGCPQRIAKKGRYGAFLMDDLPCVASLVRALHERTSTPVSAKIRIFPELSRTLEYAKLIEASGASLVAVHGRTREQKDASAVRADWDAIKAVKEALSIPVLGNGDIQSRADAVRMMEYTGVDGVLSASPLLQDPRLFWEERGAGEPYAPLKCFEMAHEYLKMCEQYPVQGHMHKILGGWLQEHTDIRDELNKCPHCTVAHCQEMVAKLEAAVRAVGRDQPVPKISERKLARLAREEALCGAKREQEREAKLLAALDKKRAAACTKEPKLDTGANGNAAGCALKKPCSEVFNSGNGRAVDSEAVAQAAGAALESGKQQIAATCTKDQPLKGLAASGAPESDQNGTSLQNLGTRRKQPRLMQTASGVS